MIDLSSLRPTSSTRIGEELAGWVRDACTGPDQISWDIALALIPTEQGPQPGYLLILRIPSPVLGQFLGHIVLIDLGSLTEPVVGHNVRQALEQLRRQRSDLLAAPMNGAGS